MKSGRKFLLTDLLYLKVFIAFGIGVVAADNIDNLWLLVSIPFIVFGLLMLSYHLLKTSRSKLGDSTVFSLILGCGIAFHSLALYDQTTSIEKLTPILDHEAYHLIRIEDKPIAKAKSLQIEASLLKSETDSLTLDVQEKILLYLPKESDLSPPYYGQIMQIQGRLSRPRPAHYPFEFDYAQWLSRKKIYTTIYSREYTVVGSDTSFVYQAMKLPLKLRDYFEKEIDRAIPEASSNAIAKSILIGIRTDIDRELYTAYADTGTIHILSISGLHFGILILFLEYLLSFFIKKETLRIGIKHSISFLYALMTGFSAPIMRSFIMFLFFDIAKWKQMRISSYNILFLSAWLILLYDTHQLFNVGYQFSYIALLGIMLIYQRTVWKIQFDSVVTNFMWKSLITLSAAWLFTVPLTIYYYHKFSLLGSLSNILVVPLTTLIMYTGFIFLLFSKLALLSQMLGSILSLLIAIQNHIITFFSHLPFSSISSNALDGFGLIVFFLFIALLLTLLYTKSRLSLRWMLFYFIIIVFYSSFLGYRLLKDEKWFLVSNYNHSAIVYKNKNTVHVFADTIDDNMKYYFLHSLTSYYNTDAPILHSKYEYFNTLPNKYSFQLESNPELLVLAKENKNKWTEYIDKRDSFVVMSNLGYAKSELITNLRAKNKYFYVY
ncbi:MAG: ComEC/Rec2 family competence protein [Chitinophagales bacterium]|jgi:competence protein ComEC|nr:ComEC family competence protein [Sphingobacteriales bacterium]